MKDNEIRLNTIALDFGNDLVEDDEEEKKEEGGRDASAETKNQTINKNHLKKLVD